MRNLHIHSHVSVLDTGMQDILFGAASAGNMFQRKIDEICIEQPNAFGIADDILVVAYDKDGTDQEDTLGRVLKVCRREKLNEK